MQRNIIQIKSIDFAKEFAPSNNLAWQKKEKKKGKNKKKGNCVFIGAFAYLSP